MTRVWYCSACGYEVGRGGRCHRCRQVLVESPLDELVEGEAAEEVGYRLDDWEDAERAELIEALIDREVRHRFEGDELVVAADDEEAVDDLVVSASAGADADGGGEAGEVDPAVLAMVTELLGGARRLREDPTDMDADADVAEVAAGMFALDRVAGIDDERWEGIGRVTRRLLGALGADVAMEEQIATEAAVLCRLLEPVVVPAAAATADRDSVGPGPGDDGPAGGEDQSDDRHQVVYDMADWLIEERARLGLALEREGIAYAWEGTDMVVSEDEWDRVDELCAEVVPPDPDDDDAGEERYRALSELFGSADRLAGDAEDRVKRTAALDAARAVTAGPIPIGMSDDQWWQVRARTKSLCDSLEDHSPPDVVRASATSLGELLRGFV
jgi:hypothetical protein